MTNIKKTYAHITVSHDTRNRFDYLKSLLSTEHRPKVSNNDMLNYLLDLIEKEKKKK